MAAREWLASNGGAAAVRDALRADGFVEAEGPGLTLGADPFNVFARLAGGAMPNLVDQGVLGTHAARPRPHYLFPLLRSIFFEVRDGRNQVVSGSQGQTCFQCELQNRYWGV